MKIIKKLGKCIQCGADSHIILDGGKYACTDCLNKVGEETRCIRHCCEDMALSADEINNIVILLNLMKSKNINSIDNAIKTLEAIQLYNKCKK